MTGDVLFQLLEEFEELREHAELERLFQRLARQYGLATVAYLGIGFGKGVQQSEPHIATTYSPEWITRYREKGYVDIDPVIQIGMRRLLPIDWSDLGSRDRKNRQLFGESTEFGVGRHGLSIPVHGRHGDRALFSITSHQSDNDWRMQRKHYIRDFQILAVHAHATLLHLHGAQASRVKLSPRERECVRWISEGKTAWECSVILGLSVHTVRCYLESARHKLSASSNSHAVAKAIKANLLISIP